MNNEQTYARQQITEDEVLLDVRNLKKYFPIHKGFLRREVGAVLVSYTHLTLPTILLV